MPADDTLRFTAVFKCSGQVVVVGFSDDRTMAEQFLLALLSVLRGEEPHAVIEGEEQVGAGFGNIPLACFELLTESVELPVGVTYRFALYSYPNS